LESDFGKLAVDVAVFDKNVKWDKKVGELQVPFGGLDPGVIVEGWYDVPGIGNGLKLNLGAQLVPLGGADLDMLVIVKSAIPDDAVRQK
jgi:hypothetical protein